MMGFVVFSSLTLKIFLTTWYILRGTLRKLLNIYDGTFPKRVIRYKPLTVFAKKTPSIVFHRVLNTPLT